MGKVSTKPPSGTRDFLPADVARRRYVVGVIEDVYQRYGFVPLETPAFENLSTLLGKYGDEGDQLLYRLLHRRDALTRALDAEEVTERNLADQGLRYDLTVPLARVVAQYRDLPRFFKRYQIQPVWRADRPGRGRFREFYQCDVDMIGTESPIAEAEVLAAIAEVLTTLGFADFTLHLNHRGLLRGLIQSAGVPLELESTALVAVDKLDKIGAEGVTKELAERGVEAEAGTKLLALLARGEDESDDAVDARLAEQLESDEGQAALRALSELRGLLSNTPAGQHLRLSPELARGLSYYTGPIFEITVSDLAGSLGGGGRYDELIGMFGKQPIPAVGGSIGLERILLLMKEREMYPDLATGPEVLLCWMRVDPKDVLSVAHRLRAQGLRVETYPVSAKLGKQLQYADSAGVKAPVAAILGETELADDQLTLKHLESGEQQKVAIAGAAEQVARWR
ncbi:MAG: histidine--tRNA ligase [Proteobacteria bacterium]|nr:MAG: histidine--tRNA ligase [Pseudomonadota bacterium]PIE19713.1 MAG: histidine--tRNA ligase [Pseudomonadota bacterium]